MYVLSALALFVDGILLYISLFAYYTMATYRLGCCVVLVWVLVTRIARLGRGTTITQKGGRVVRTILVCGRPPSLHIPM